MWVEPTLRAAGSSKVFAPLVVQGFALPHSGGAWMHCLAAVGPIRMDPPEAGRGPGGSADEGTAVGAADGLIAGGLGSLAAVGSNALACSSRVGEA